jgi:regulator of sirC expression with transglutaminase-like and TPR domain
MLTRPFRPSTHELQDHCFCRPEAYQLFVEQLPKLHTTAGLLRAAIAVSMHALDDVDPDRVEHRLQILSLRIRERCSSDNPTAIQANLHAVLFDEEGFAGNLDRYYNALNSYLPAVLNSRRGLPLVLALIYKVVGEGCGLAIQGINSPGHFLVRVRCKQSWMIVDPFFSGQMLTREEAFRRLERVTGQRLPRRDDLLATPSHDQWIARLLGNLRQLFATEGRRDDLAAMNELTQALNAWTARRAAS